MPRLTILLTLLWALVAGPLLWASGPLAPDETVKRLKTPVEISVELFAAEPQITNPTNIDVDERGRLWVCDVQNYRGNQGTRPEGDRILVLEDADRDGRADVVKTFYQGTDVDSALGICVLPGPVRRVIVSCSPNVWLFTDRDGDDLPDEKVALFTRSGRPQHDHCVHAFVFGPDGRFYWNTGNEHDGIHDARGEAVVDRFDRPVLPAGKPYRQGMAFRSHLDGSQFDVLAHNQRNSYELTVDSFGRVWFSDNDDDGNRGTRISLVLEGGNNGYTDELTGQSWRTGRRTNQSDNVSRRHWHQNDPGVVPNVALLGNGSPSGIMIYEGQSLATLRGRLVHCEPGRNLVRQVRLVPDGAGYQADVEPLIDGQDDPWFRPVDAAVGPDGAIYVADWYDPGVGGHRQADVHRGRIYRLQADDAPPRSASSNGIDAAGPMSLQQAIAALGSGCQAIRYLGWQRLADLGSGAAGTLQDRLGDDNPVLRARAAWLLARMPEHAAETIDRLSQDDNPSLRETAVRIARWRGDVDLLLALLDRLVDDPSPQVRRACAIALRDLALPGESSRPLKTRRTEAAGDHPATVAQLWRRLALQYAAGDRWMLEALGLAADGRWDAMLEVLDVEAGGPLEDDPAWRDLIWRSRGTRTLSLLASILGQSQLSLEETRRTLRAIDFQPLADQSVQLEQLLDQVQSLAADRRRLITSEVLARIRPDQLGPSGRRALHQYLEEAPRDGVYAWLTVRFRVAEHYADLLSIVLDRRIDMSVRTETLRFLLDRKDSSPLTQQLAEPGANRDQLIRVLADAPHPAAGRLLWPIAINDKEALDLRREAIRAVARQRSAAEQAVATAEEGQLDEPMQTALFFALQGKPWNDLRQRAARLAPAGIETSGERLPVDQWMEIRGDAGRGREHFFGKANCSTCHQVRQEGKNVGPPLDGIGVKLSRTGLYEAILYPSAAISHNYPTYAAISRDGLAVKGLLVSETESHIALKNEQGVVQEFARDELEQLERQNVSLMPAGLHRTLTPQEIADLVAYLAQLDES